MQNAPATDAQRGHVAHRQAAAESTARRSWRVFVVGRRFEIRDETLCLKSIKTEGFSDAYAVSS